MATTTETITETKTAPDWVKWVSHLKKNPYPWPHSSNFRSMLLLMIKRRKYTYIPDLFNRLVIVTEKIHGSNISIVLEYDPATGWHVVRYHSRKLVLEEDLTDAQLNGTPMFPILEQYHDRLIALATTLFPEGGPKQLLFHGELHIGDSNPKATSHLVSNLEGGFHYGDDPFWKPFGYQVVTDAPASDVHWLGDTLREHFLSHGLETPRILFRGHLSDAITELYELLTAHNTEGGFVTTVDGERGFKWKDAVLSESDDQKFAFGTKISEWTPEQLAEFQDTTGLTLDVMKSLRTIDEIFFHGDFEKPKYKEPKMESGEPNHARAMSALIKPGVLDSLTSHGHTLPTKASIASLGKMQKKIEISRVVDLFFEDILSEYTRDLPEKVTLTSKQIGFIKGQISKWYNCHLFRG